MFVEEFCGMGSKQSGSAREVLTQKRQVLASNREHVTQTEEQSFVYIYI
jgi:hypothetical protein